MPDLYLNEEEQENEDFWRWMRQSGGSKELSSILQPVVGRNEPCPCESGKKFKKCCGGHIGPEPEPIVTEQTEPILPPAPWPVRPEIGAQG